ncbi:YggU family protein [Candidatus Woesearchaeota archaeon]|nr:YggU family protein [Candidatus Woesearchaeota archaeon]
MLSDYLVNNKIHISVKPNAKKTEILSYDAAAHIVKIAVAAPADKDKANKELLKFVSRQLKKKVAFVSGLRSKEKILKIME